jgi:hypothetical protein
MKERCRLLHHGILWEEEQHRRRGKRKTLLNSQKLYATPKFSCIDLAAMSPSTEPIEELSWSPNWLKLETIGAFQKYPDIHKIPHSSRKNTMSIRKGGVNKYKKLRPFSKTPNIYKSLTIL